MVHTLWKSVKGKKGKLWEPAPKCHRVMRRAGHQKVTTECLLNSQSLFYLRYPETPVSLHSPQGETDVRSPRGYDVTGVGGGEFALRLVPRQRAAPHYWRSSSHTHTHMCPHVSGTECMGFSKQDARGNLVVDSLPVIFSLSTFCQRFLMHMSVELNMNHTFLTH